MARNYNATRNMNPNAEILVLDESGTNLGKMSYGAALNMSSTKGLDLVKVNDSEGSPVFKIMDKGKYQYQKKKKNKKSTVHSLKEINFKMRIDIHDRETKINHIKRFLSKGMDVKISIQLRGREKGNPGLARKLLEEILSSIEELAVVKDRKYTPSMVSAMVRTNQGIKNATTKESNEKNNSSRIENPSKAPAAV